MEIGIDSSAPSEAVQPQISPTDRQNGTSTEKFVTFQLGEVNYAIQAASVAEVSEILPLTSLPGMPAGLLGISPLRGEIVAKVDLRRMLDEKAHKSANPKAKEIVLDRTAAGAIQFSFAVDRLGEITTIDVSKIRPAESGSDVLIGEVEIDGRTLRVVDHRRVIASIDPECCLPCPH